MRTLWIKLGCFLTGYNYHILKNCSEASKKRLLRYTSAILIVSLLWAFIGYAFANRYLKTEFYTSILAACISVFVIIQIERQIILAHKSNRGSVIMRVVIAFTMAVIGSVIIDQILLKEDIEQQKIFLMDSKIKKVYPGKAAEHRRLIAELDSTILSKEMERRALIDDISKNPKITMFNRQVESEGLAGNQPDSARRERVVRTATQVSNPKIALLEPLDKQIEGLRENKLKKDSSLIQLRPAIEAELRSNVGFLDELDLMMSIFSESTVALIVWILWFLLLIGLEIFILVSKLNEDDTDYDRMIHQQEQLHFKRIELLAKQ